MKRIFAAIGALLLLLTGCAGTTGSLQGKWTGTLNLSKAIDADTLPLTDANITLVYEFGADGQYTLTADKGSVESAGRAIRTAFRNQLEQKYREQLSADGSSLTVEEYLAGIGSSLDAQADAVFGEETVAVLVEAMTATGRYELDGDTLYCSPAADTPAKEGTAYGITLTEHTFTLTLDGDDSGLFPLEFKR